MARLLSHPSRLDAPLSAGPAFRGRLYRRPVSLQRHHAASRRFRTIRSSSATRRCWSTRACRSSSSSSRRTRSFDHDRRHIGHGVQGGLRRHSRFACLQAARFWPPRQVGAVFRRARRASAAAESLPHKFIRREVLRRGGHCQERHPHHHGVPHREYRDLDYRGKPVVDIWNFLGRGGLCESGDAGY